MAIAGFLLKPPTAAAGVVDCAAEQPDSYECWRDRMLALVERESPKVALDDARDAYDTIPFVSTNCHQIAHEIGRAGGRKYGDVAAAFEQGDDFCWSGYYHGVMEAIADQVGQEDLFAEVNDICTGTKVDKPYGSDHYNCVHGLGHGFMAVTHIQLFTALEGCDGYLDSWERESCYGGVFMENIMSRINPNHDTQFLRDDDPLYPCTEVGDSYKQQCYLMQTSHALQVVGYDYAAVFGLCESVEESYRATCLQSLGRDVSGNTQSDVASTVSLCTLAESEFAQLNCFIGAAKDYIHYFHNDDESLALCAAIENAEISRQCTEIAISHYATL